MHFLVGCDQLKIVREGLSDDLPVGEVVAGVLLLPPDEVDQGLEGDVKHDGAEGVACEDAVPEEERDGLPLLCDHHPYQLGVQAECDKVSERIQSTGGGCSRKHLIGRTSSHVPSSSSV